MMRTRTNMPSARCAFTLLEVMMSVVIIGLGVLGLSAIFAGAASQQAASVRSTEAAAMLARVERIIHSRVGAASIDPAPPLGGSGGVTLTAFQYEDGITFPGTPTAWYALSAYPERQSAQGHPDHAITLDPEIDPTASVLRAYFAVQAPGLELYSNPLDYTAERPIPIYYPSNPYGTTPNFDAARIVRYVAGGPTASGIDTGTTGQFAGHFFDSFTGVPRIRLIPHSRLDLGAFRVRFEIARKDSNQMSARVIDRRVVYFDDAANVVDQAGQPYPDSDLNAMPNQNPAMTGTGLRQVHGLPQSSFTIGNFTPTNRVLVDRFPFVNVVDINAAGAATAEILEFDIALRPYEWIERIVLEPYVWRNDVLLTLPDRVQRRPDGGYTGVVVFMQENIGGIGRRLALLAYNAEPVNRGQASAWIPPESGASNDPRLLRLGEVDLGFEADTGRYYIRPDNATDEWLVTPGQRLLFAGDRTSGGPLPLLDQGADDFVTVVEQVRSPELRGYLNAPPRSGGIPLLPYTDTDDEEGPLDVWALYPLAGSLATGRPQFRITPLDTTITHVR